MASTAHCPSSTLLLDVLEEVPLNVVNDNVWQVLHFHDRRHWRLSSRRCLQLADSLITHACHEVDVHPAQGTKDDVPAQDSEDDEQEEEEAAKDNSIASWAALLSRLPRLSSLELREWDTDESLTRAALHLGAATGSRVTRLALRGTLLSASSGCAVRAAFPGLQELVLGSSVRALARLEAGGDGKLWQRDDFFLPLKDASLTSLKMEDRGRVKIESLRVLTRLRRLDLDLYRVRGYDLEHLSAFTDLRHLRLDCLCASYTSKQSAVIYALTRLTHLCLNVRHGEEDTTADALYASGGAALSHLSHLQALHLEDLSVMDATLFADVRQLTRLTALSVGRLALPSHAAALRGCLPALCTLRVDGLRPYDLLHTLLPLLPLPSLTSLYTGAGALCIDVGDAHDAVSGGGDSAVQAAALREVGLHLGAAAQLQMPTLCLAHTQATGNKLSLQQVAEGVAPLAARLSHLRLYNMAAQEWEAAALGAAFPGLLRLDVNSCTITAEWVADVARHLAALERLDLIEVEVVLLPGVAVGAEVEGEGGVGAESEREASVWLGLAGARSQPLLLVADRLPTDEVMARCRGVQEERFARQNITWDEWVRGAHGLL